MRNPAEILGQHLSDTSSRRGFLATLGKIALLGGGALAALGGERAYAASCSPSACVYGGTNYGYSCPPGDADDFVSCCTGSGGLYETRVCTEPGGRVDCQYTFGPVGPNCLHTPAP